MKHKIMNVVSYINEINLCLIFQEGITIKIGSWKSKCINIIMKPGTKIIYVFCLFASERLSIISDNCICKTFFP